eukprot:1160464-Pelagomonas_calceolata.AAC.8
MKVRGEKSERHKWRLSANAMGQQRRQGWSEATVGVRLSRCLCRYFGGAQPHRCPNRDAAAWLSSCLTQARALPSNGPKHSTLHSHSHGQQEQGKQAWVPIGFIAKHTYDVDSASVSPNMAPPQLCAHSQGLFGSCLVVTC